MAKSETADSNASLDPSKAASRGTELVALEVTGLFGIYDHRIEFSHAGEGTQDPALLILHGRNGIGKTTLLLMLDGLLRLDFDVFRVRPFATAALTLSSRRVLRVRSNGPGAPLQVTYGGHRVTLHGTRKGPDDEVDRSKVEALRESFLASTRDIIFQLITTDRAPHIGGSHEAISRETYLDYSALASMEDSPEVRLRSRLRSGPREERAVSLPQRVRRFVTDAQVDYRRYFRTEYDLFARVLEVVESDTPPALDAQELLDLATRIRRLEQTHARLGLPTSKWEYGQVAAFLQKTSPKAAARRQWALAALAAYLQGLEERARERDLVAQRLVAFEREIGELFEDKKVSIGRSGLTVKSASGVELVESQLSSGEFHLLYLMTAALTARRRGTVIAIDEPEMSMHLSWQRRLISSLLTVASDARPQLVLATHSPEVVGEYRSYMTRLGSDSGNG